MIRFLLLAAALLLALPARSQEDARIRQSSEELQRVQARIQALSQKMERERGRQSALRQQLEDLEKQIGDTSGRIREVASLIAAQQGRIGATEDEVARAQRALNAQKRALAGQIRSTYLIGERGQLRLLLNQESAQKLDRIATYFDYLHRARARYIENIHARLDDLAAIQDRLAQQHLELKKLKDQQQKTLAALEATRVQRSQTIREIDQQLAGDLGEIKQLQANEKAIQSLLQSLRDALADIPLNLGRDARPFPKLRGKLPWPLRGKLLAAFGQAKAGGRLNWNGLWIEAPEGAPVRAVANGRVAYVGWLQRYGLIVILEHESGYFTLYGHNHSVGRTEGEWVGAGDTIARAGATGGYEQPGLYFEIRKGTQPVNPAAWLTR